MQKLAEICIRRPVFAAMIILALVVVGAASYGRLGVDRFPSVDLPTVSVRTTLPGSSTEETEAEISQPIEEAVNTVEGIQELRSVSSARGWLAGSVLATHRPTKNQKPIRSAQIDTRVEQFEFEGRYARKVGGPRDEDRACRASGSAARSIAVRQAWCDGELLALAPGGSYGADSLTRTDDLPLTRRLL
ncbi:MAG TPA: efflux RND transporter permease subunit, partial [Thermoanaerobaculia bacterium]|nr:efflux RND transporter permease subunit [Thermoanaerobaculia bacterium]